MVVVVHVSTMSRVKGLKLVAKLCAVVLRTIRVAICAHFSRFTLVRRWPAVGIKNFLKLLDSFLKSGCLLFKAKILLSESVILRPQEAVFIVQEGHSILYTIN